MVRPDWDSLSGRGGSRGIRAWCGFGSGDTTNTNRSPGDVGDSGGSQGFAPIKNCDPITIDAEKRTITLDVPAAEIKARRAKWKAPKPRYTTGVLAKYAKLVSSASECSVTDKDLGL